MIPEKALDTQWAECVMQAERAYGYQWTERDRMWFADWLCGEGRILLASRLASGMTLDEILHMFDEYAILLWGDKVFQRRALNQVDHTGLRCSMNAYLWMLLERITTPDDDYPGEPPSGLVQAPASVGRCIP